MTLMTPPVTPDRTGVRIHRRSSIQSWPHIDRILINDHCRRRHHDRGHFLLDEDGWRMPILIGWNFAIAG
jgi:hypothetical protein